MASGKFQKAGAVEAADHILSLNWSPDGSMLLATPATGPIQVLSPQADLLNELGDHGQGNGLSEWNATCGFDGTIRLYENPATSPQPAQTFSPGRGWIERVKWSPDGQYLAASLGKKVFLANPDGEITETFDTPSAVMDFCWNPVNDREFATVGAGGARMWRRGESAPFAKFDWGGASVLASWSADGRWLLTGDQTASVHLYDFTRDYPLHIQGYETKVKAMSFSPDAQKLATGGGPMITVWNCTGKSGPENSVPDQLSFHKGDVENLAWSPDGSLLASGDLMGRLVLSDVKGKPVSAFQDDESVSALAWAPDGSRLAVGDAAGRVVVFARPE